RSWLRMGPDDTTVSWLPVHHDMGLIGCLLTPLVNGTDLWLLRPEQFVRDPMRFLRCLARAGDALSAMPAFGLRYIARRVTPAEVAGLDLSRWRGCIVAAEPVHSEDLDAFARLLAPAGLRREALLPAYGLAEATLAVTGVAPDVGWTSTGVEGRRAVGCGPPLPGVGVEILDEHGARVPDGCRGEVAVRGPAVCRPYGSVDDHAARW